MKNIIITVDGPAASGKEKISKYISKKWQLKHLDSGILYRNLAYIFLQNGINLNDSSIREQEIRENHIPRIKELWSKDEIDGYNCSSCDSFLLFLCCYFDLEQYFAA